MVCFSFYSYCYLSKPTIKRPIPLSISSFVSPALLTMYITGYISIALSSIPVLSRSFLLPCITDRHMKYALVYYNYQNALRIPSHQFLPYSFRMVISICRVITHFFYFKDLRSLYPLDFNVLEIEHFCTHPRPYRGSSLPA